jgi:hypothetical protein
VNDQPADLQAKESSPLVIVGMHRSGTSLTARWLQMCGLHLGSELVPATRANREGHFEDLEITRLHREILRRNGLTYLTPRDVPIKTTEQDHLEAQRLVTEREAGGSAWGWKDPRTSLFLPFWHDIVPEARYLIVYRHYTQVVDSLLRRDKLRPLHVGLGAQGEAGRTLISKQRRDEVVARYSNLSETYRRVASVIQRMRSSYFNWPLVSLFAAVWQTYNRRIMAFAKRNPERCLVLSLEDLPSVAGQVLSFLTSNWQFPLEPVDFSEAFNPTLLHRREMPRVNMMCRFFRPGIDQTYHELENMRDTSFELHGLSAKREAV